eukprot:m.1169533 g.1169533  ORF g.1169533 m.1169533 type:complete len:473 (-) comp24509_c1_seq11:3513-4931(-)
MPRKRASQGNLAVYLLCAIGAWVACVYAEEAAKTGDVHPLPPDVPPGGGDRALHQPQDHGMDIHADDYKGLSPDAIKELKVRKKHEEWHKKHAGHEGMHAEMLLILMLTMILTQILLVLWKKHYFESYQATTLLGMWIIPVYFSWKSDFTRFLSFWTIFSIFTGFVVWKATRKPLSPRTPRRVYTFFTAIYKSSYIITFTGYFLALLDFVGLGVIIQAMLHDRKAHPLIAFGMQLMFYGLYFGVLSRDFAEICADSMASVIGYYRPGGGIANKQLPTDVCAICGEKLADDDVEKIVKLPCDHQFHEFCVRGWSIIGKKHTCPYCNEKVDLKKLFPHPWSLGRQDVLFSQLLDALRYLVVCHAASLLSWAGAHVKLLGRSRTLILPPIWVPGQLIRIIYFACKVWCQTVCTIVPTWSVTCTVLTVGCTRSHRVPLRDEVCVSAGVAAYNFHSGVWREPRIGPELRIDTACRRG